MKNIEIYYDGVEIEKNNNSLIKGFTTNISFLKTNGIKDYEQFIKKSLLYTDNRPISFQIYDDEDEEIYKNSKKIQSYSESIFVKIPVIKTNGEYNKEIIKELHNDNVQINVTAIFTKKQIDSLKDIFGNETNVIISIFAGRINDSGIDSTETVNYAVEMFKEYKNIKILWAACRTIYNIIEAEKQGAHIVTIPDSVLSRLYRLQQTPEEASLETVNTFKKDGINGQIKL